MVNMANGPHHPNPQPENVQLVNVGLCKVTLILITVARKLELWAGL